MVKVAQSLIANLTRIRNYFYDSKYLSTVKLPPKVISIGNITMGGTGKTPFTLWLVAEIKNKKLAIVTKSYKGGLKEPKQVSTGYNEARHFGDEAVLLALKNPLLPVWAGPNKTETAKELLKSEKALEALIIDDGFQHRKLHRDLDIVLLDTSVHVMDYEFPPAGRARELLSESQRADVFVLTKTEQAQPTTLSYLNEQLGKYHAGKIILKSKQISGEPRFFAGRKETLKRDLIVFSGLGNPQAFLNTVQSAGIQILKHMSFQDHKNYEPSDIAKIIMESAESQYLTTEKDAVKLQDWPVDGPPLFVLPLSLEVAGDMEKFYEKLNSILR